MNGADLALYHAKATGRNRFCVLEPAMQEAAGTRRRLESELAGAFERRELHVLDRALGVGRLRRP